MACETCKESFLDSYDVTVDSVKQSKPDLSPHDVRLLAAQQFRPIFHEMKAAGEVEDSGAQEYENGEFTITPDGRIFYPRTGDYAEDLHLKQLRLSELREDATRYSVTDHQTTLLVQKAFAGGATVVRTSYAREDGDNRDVLTFRYDLITKKGKIEITNTVMEGKPHSFEAIKQIARAQDAQLIEVAVSNKVFILTDRVITATPEPRHDESYQVERRNSIHVNTDYLSRPVLNKEHSPLGVKSSSSDTTLDIKKHPRISDSPWKPIRDIIRDTQEGLKQSVLFLGNKERRREAKEGIVALPIVDQVRKLLEGKKVDKQDKRPASPASSSLGGSERERGEQEPGDKRSVERLTFAKIREKSVLVREVIQRQHVEMLQTVRALAIVAETRVAVGAVPLLIATLAKEQPPMVRVVEKSVSRQERKARKVQQRERITLAEIRKKPEPIGKTIVKRHKEMRQMMRAAKIAVELNVAGAIPYLISTLTKEQPRGIKATEKSIRRHKRGIETKRFRVEKREKKAVEKSLRRHKRKTEGVRLQKKKRGMERNAVKAEVKHNKRKNNSFSVERKVLHRKIKESKHTLKPVEKKKRKRKEAKGRVVSKIERRSFAPSAHKETKVVRSKERRKRKTKRIEILSRRVEKNIKNSLELKGIKGNEKLLWIALVRLTRERRRKLSILKSPQIETKQAERQRVEQKITMQFAYTWTLFMLLNLPKTPERDVGSARVGDVSKEKTTRVDGVPTPWILLSIIFYLSAIREQGMAVANSSSLTPIQSGLIVQRKKNHTKSNHRLQQGKRVTRFLYPVVNSLSRYGVIYYYQAPFKNLTSL